MEMKMTAAEILVLLADSTFYPLNKNDKTLFPGVKNPNARIKYFDDGRAVLLEDDYVEVYAHDFELLGQFRLSENLNIFTTALEN